MHVVLAAGGTAGHIFPALNTAIAILDLAPKVRITILGTSRGLDRELVTPTGFELKLVSSAPFPRKINSQAFMFPYQFLRAVKETREFLKREEIRLKQPWFSKEKLKMSYWVNRISSLRTT